MNLARKTVRAAVAEIKKVKDLDPEKAHTLEDALYKRVLEAVAADKQPSAELSILAKEALETQKFDFARICG